MLTLKFVPYSEISNLDINRKVSKLIGYVKEDKILVVEGKLTPEEETALIEKTMEQIKGRFKGIEICSVANGKNSKNKEIGNAIRSAVVKMLIGNREGLTIVGPASIIKEIRKDPNKIELLTRELRKRRKR